MNPADDTTASERVYGPVGSTVVPATPDADDTPPAAAGDVALTEAERADMHMALSDSYDDLDEFVHTLIADRVVAAKAVVAERIAQAIENPVVVESYGTHAERAVMADAARIAREQARP